MVPDTARPELTWQGQRIFGERLVSDEELSEHLKLLRQQTVLAKFGELALRSDNLVPVFEVMVRPTAYGLGGRRGGP